MSKTLHVQHPAVVLRSHYRNLKALLAVVLVAVLALGATVVMLGRDDDGVTGSVGAVSSTPSVAKPDESKIAAGISARQRFATRPDESRIAAAIGPSEASGAAARDQAYQDKIRSMTPDQIAAAYGE